MTIRTKKINLKQITIEKFDSLIEDKYKLLKSDTIYFDKESGDIEMVTFRDGYNVFLKKGGYRIFPRAVNGKEFIDIINCIKENKFYSYTKGIKTTLKNDKK